MKYPFKILNKRKFLLRYINAFIVNICLYMMPVVLAIFTTQPFTLNKLKYLIISIIGLKLTEVILNHLWVIYILRFENKYAKDLQLAYFSRIAKMKPYKLNKVHMKDGQIIEEGNHDELMQKQGEYYGLINI